MAGWFPRIYDAAMKPVEKTHFEKIRADLIRRAQGRVLEIGFGTGANFRYYRNVDRVDAIEPNPAMGKQAAKRIKKSPIPIFTYQAIAEELPFPDNTFDSVVATLVFCTIPDPIRAIQEIRRVSRPGAKILLFEHVKMDRKILGQTQEALTPIWRRLCDGCHLNRNTLGLVEQSGLNIQKVTSNYGGLFLTIECTNAL
ncbi:class I SAM-dependent methyltransferase [Planococcus sp. CPCC 101016]|uniref:class I SAM-dependent methyltransferase n=1 Tax=Planococcus sp. CPCC 101016 TaxID=2599617 RepID=UPI0011B5F8F6|nr:class I SAM-dependent methyltransferase [Planococcus sp. CPCC 101016]TWT07885.1 class I SAM-dependent methyltransferase [Planococcus sp. CPCC 101016]